MLPKLVLSTFQQWNFTWHERKQKNVSVLTRRGVGNKALSDF